MKWGLFVLTDMPVVTLSWLGPAVKTGLQNISGQLFPGTCALWPLTPYATPLPSITAVEVFVLGDENGPTRLFCVTASTAAQREASHDQSLPSTKHTGVNLRASCCVCVHKSKSMCVHLHPQYIFYILYNSPDIIIYTMAMENACFWLAGKLKLGIRTPQTYPVLNH